MTETINGAFPIVPYPDERAAIAWLERALGAEAIAVHPPEPDQPVVHAEVRVGTGGVMLNRANRSDGRCRSSRRSPPGRARRSRASRSPGRRAP